MRANNKKKKSSPPSPFFLFFFLCVASTTTTTVTENHATHSLCRFFIRMRAELFNPHAQGVAVGHTGDTRDRAGEVGGGTKESLPGG